ncbi:hypothetical protein Sjap_015649 [Stephania japonica]|uniref:MADS-box domain-containing protein n=1 Tax=Stephania japonica TaxID=461633 RepID=A0AAP0ILG6_9MAGN
MGRVKLKIKRIESSSNRQITYSKRKTGIVKKTKELSILCDIDAILLMFSPSGKPTLCLGEHSSSIEDILARYAQLTPQERAKRKLESLEALKKTFKKLDHDVNVQEFLGTSSQTVEYEIEHVNELTVELKGNINADYQFISILLDTSNWADPEKIDSVEHLRAMEQSLKESLNRIRTHKENLGKEQLIALECTTQFQNGMHIPLGMVEEQHAESLSWIPGNENQHMILPDDHSLLHQRDMECATDVSLPSYSAYFGTGKQPEIDSSGQEGNGLHDLSRNACLGLQLSDQYPPYSQYNLNLSCNKGVKPESQDPHVNYELSNNFEIMRPPFDAGHHTWASTSGPCAVPQFDNHLYSQVCSTSEMLYAQSEFIHKGNRPDKT